MKTILLSLTLSLLITGNVINLNPSCPEQSVPDINKICITPSFIEGCLTYKSANECYICSSSIQYFI